MGRTGLAAMDVRFKGRRVAYELALNEATAHYSGSGGDQSFYLDAGLPNSSHAHPRPRKEISPLASCARTVSSRLQAFLGCAGRAGLLARTGAGVLASSWASAPTARAGREATQTSLRTRL